MPLEALGSQLGALGSVILIDIVLAGDNAVVVGMAACGLPAEQRRRAIAIGIVVAMLCRIAFALIAIQLLAIVGLQLAGGLLLLWVAWKMWIEARVGAAEESAALLEPQARKTFGQAALQIAIADVSMSLDNVLAVAGAARDHPYIMAVGLILSVVLMGVGASLVANLLNRWRWLTYLGLVIVLYVALAMIYEGGHDVLAEMG